VGETKINFERERRKDRNGFGEETEEPGNHCKGEKAISKIDILIT
jgi:hypothetical protein